MTDTEYAPIIRKWQRAVFTVLARITGQPGCVQPLAQKTFADAYSQMSRCAEPQQHRLLLRIATSHAIEYLRRSPGSSFAPLDRLAPELRALIVLAETEALSSHDLSYIAGISEETVEQRVRTIREMLASPQSNLAPRGHVVMSCAS